MNIFLYFFSNFSQKNSNHAKLKTPPNAARGINTVALLFSAPRMQRGVN